MSLLKWAIFGLLMLPFAEIVVFVAVALKIGFLAAIALTILTSLAGASVVRNAGQSSVARVRTAFGERVISRTTLDGPGFLTVVGGLLLVLPGFLTDILGALLLLPVTRYGIQAALRHAVARSERAARDPSAIDLAPDQWHRVPDERLPHRPSGRRD
ncbi:MAG TPA: FxsA family protein [Xanthobacteraceae bacterium]|nr:FxsA family protein [Xanthobacteraceae bacterium]